MRGNKARNNWNLLRGRGLAVAVGVAMAAIAAIAVGCGSSSTAILPFAGLWVANSGNGEALHYAGTEVRASGTANVPPKTILNSATLISPQDVLFDSNAGMWVVDGGKDDGKGTGAALYHYTAGQLAALNTTSNPVPTIAITSAQFNFPQFAALDSSGNLWVADSANSEIFKFTAAQISVPHVTPVTPVATLTSTDFNGTLGIAFDSSGNLWIDNNGSTTIVQISSATLATASGLTAVTPAVILESSVLPGGLPTINNPWGIVFDADGNLWFTNEQLSVSACSGSVVEFTKASIAASGTPTPNVVLTQTPVSTTESLCDPNGISINSAGDIAVANAAGNSLAQYSESQTGASGNPVPELFIFGTLTTINAPTGLSYGPLLLQ